MRSIRPSRAKKWSVLLAMGLFVMACIVAGCGSSSSGSGNTAGSSNTAKSGASGASDQLVSVAKQATAQYEQVPQSIGITARVPKAIPSGKTIDFQMCGAPACQAFETPLEQAAAALGWKVKVNVAGPSPQLTASAWNTAVADHPSAVISSGFPSAMWSKQLSELKGEGVPVVECCTLDQPGNGILAVVHSFSAGSLGGKMMADWTIANSDGRANTLFINLPAYPIVGAERAGFMKEIGKCTGCHVTTYDENVNDLGQPSGASKIVSTLQSHPDIKYLVAGDDDSYIGLPAALSSAGLSNKVQAIGLDPNTPTQNYIKNGQVVKASVSFPTDEIAWQWLDVLSRHFVGASTAPDSVNMPLRILTAGAIANPNVLAPTTPSYKSDYLNLWGKS